MIETYEAPICPNCGYDEFYLDCHSWTYSVFGDRVEEVWGCRRCYRSYPPEYWEWIVEDIDTRNYHHGIPTGIEEIYHAD